MDLEHRSAIHNFPPLLVFLTNSLAQDRPLIRVQKVSPLVEVSHFVRNFGRVTLPKLIYHMTLTSSPSLGFSPDSVILAY